MELRDGVCTGILVACLPSRSCFSEPLNASSYGVARVLILRRGAGLGLRCDARGKPTGARYKNAGWRGRRVDRAVSGPYRGYRPSPPFILQGATSVITAAAQTPWWQL